jgi:hypothetical protein
MLAIVGNNTNKFQDQGMIMQKTDTVISVPTMVLAQGLALSIDI